MPQLLILYDTSFLMNAERMPSFLPSQISGPNNWFQKHVIPIEVKQELLKHMDSEEKGILARRGRTLVAKIMAHEDYQEVSLADSPFPKLLENVLGPDSDVDKKLLGYALTFLADNPTGAAFLATHDGGIQTEVSARQSHQQLNLYSPVSKNKLQKFIDTSEAERAAARVAQEFFDSLDYTPPVFIQPTKRPTWIQRLFGG